MEKLEHQGTEPHWEHPMESKVLPTHINCRDKAVKEIKKTAEPRHIVLFCLPNTRVFTLFNLWFWSPTENLNIHVYVIESEYSCVCHCPLLDKSGNVVHSCPHDTVICQIAAHVCLVFGLFIFQSIVTCSILIYHNNNALK